MSATPNIALQLLTRQQSAKETTINDALVKIDTAIGALQVGGGGGGGSADGTNRLFHMNVDSVPTSHPMLEVYAGQGQVQCVRYDLTDATTGDAIDMLIESTLDTAGALAAIFVLPATFTRGPFSVDCRLPFNLFLATEASLAAPLLDATYQLAPGVVQLNPGFTEYALVETQVGNTYLPKLVSIKQGVVTVETRDFSVVAPTVGQTFECVLTSGINTKLMGYNPQSSINVLSDKAIQLHVEIFEWDYSGRAWQANAIGDYLWTNTYDGQCDYTTLVANSPMGIMNVPGQGSYSMLPSNCKVKVSVVGFPDGAPAFMAVAINVMTLIN